MSTRQAKVWVVDSAFTGELNARIGLAEYLGFDFEVIPLPEENLSHYAAKLYELDAPRRQLDPLQPLIVLSGTGEDTVTEWADFKQRTSRVLNVYLASILPDDLNPRLCEYDLIATPQLEGENVVRTIGVAHNVTHSRIHSAQARHQYRFSKLQAPIFALLLGGNTFYCDGFDAKHGRDLAERVYQLVHNHQGSLIVTNSRRTPAPALQVILEVLSELEPLFFDWRSSPNDLYPAILGVAEVIIVTGDSLSMCSEGSYTGKPVLVDISEQATEIYHRQIMEGLFEYGAARHLQDYFEPWSYPPIDTTARVATAIQNKLRDMLL